MKRPIRLIIFASGTETGGGSGAEELIRHYLAGDLAAIIVAVVSNHPNGGVRQKAERFGIPFIYFKGPYTAEMYQKIVAETHADFVALSGWLKKVVGLDPKTTFNIHPGPLPEFGGKGMHGIHVHEAVLRAFKEGRITHSAVCMHFVTAEYDKGPVFFRKLVEIRPDDTPETLAKRVNAVEHQFQWAVTNEVVRGRIYWDGQNPESLVVPDGYLYHVA